MKAVFLTKIRVLISLIIVTTSLNANALVLAVFDENPHTSEKKQNTGALIAGGSVWAYIFIGGSTVVTAATGVGLLIGVVLDGNSIDAKSVVLDPAKHLNDLADAGVYSPSEATTIAREVESMKKDTESKLARLGCQSNEDACNVDKKMFQKEFAVSQSTLDFLASLKGIQN